MPNKNKIISFQYIKQDVRYSVADSKHNSIVIYNASALVFHTLE